MYITEETLSDLTSRVKQAYQPIYRHEVNNSWVISQLKNIDNIPFISLSRQYTLSGRYEYLELKSYGNAVEHSMMTEEY
jgi:hypothetical protein